MKETDYLSAINGDKFRGTFERARFPTFRERPYSEIVSLAISDFSSLRGFGSFRTADLETFVREHVRTLQIHDTDVTLISWEYEDDPAIHPFLQAYIGSPRSAIVIPEYFIPELRQNAHQASLVNRILHDHWLSKTYDDGSPNNRICFAEALTDVCRTYGKVVAVADIANKPAYEISKYFWRFFQFELLIPLPSEFFLTQMGVSLFSRLFYNKLLHLLQTKDIGVYDRNRMHTFERFIVNFEDSRRLLIASGIKQLTRTYRWHMDHPASYQSAQSPSFMPQIIVCYPPAHIRRIIQYLQYPYAADAMKTIVQKLAAPTLDYQIRIWEYKNLIWTLHVSGFRWDKPSINTQQTHTPKTDLAGWRLIAQHPFSAFLRDPDTATLNSI